MSYRTVKRDANHIEISNALKSAGFTVIDAAMVGGSFPDLIVSKRPAETCVCEIKVPEGQIYLSQLLFAATWAGYIFFASSAEEAIRKARSPMLYALKDDERKIIMQIYNESAKKSKDSKPRITVKAFEKRFAELSKFRG